MLASLITHDPFPFLRAYTLHLYPSFSSSARRSSVPTTGFVLPAARHAALCKCLSVLILQPKRSLARSLPYPHSHPHSRFTNREQSRWSSVYVLFAGSRGKCL